MNATSFTPAVIIKTLIGFFITLGTALTTLLNAPGVTGFGDISQASYALAFIGAAISALVTLQAAISDSPANIKQADQIVAAAAGLSKKQGGFSSTGPMWLSLAFVGLLAACSQLGIHADTPRQQLLAAYGVAESTAQSIGIAKQAGVITAEQRDDYLVRVREARSILNDARTLITDPAPGTTDDEITQKLQLARSILLVVQNHLPRETSP